MKTTTLTLYILVLVMLSLGAKAQVTVGSGMPAKAGAILDIKQYDDDVSKAGGRTADKGFMLPRLALTDLNSLADIDPTNTTKRPDPKQHIGLIIYNLTDNTATGGVLQEGTYMWDGEKWQRMGLKDAQGYGPWYRVDDPNLPSRKVDDDSFLEAKVVIGGRAILDDADLSVHGKTILKGETMIDGQATLGMNAKPTLGSLLDVKSQQAKATTDPNSDDNITSTKGGLLLPRVKLQGTATLKPFLTAAEETPEAQAALTGLMVYNINGTPPLETGIYTWDGTLWLTAGFTKTAQSMSIAVQPKEFSFYETGEETPEPLEFKVNPPVHIDGSVGAVTYQWYQMTGNNVHVRVGSPIGNSGTIDGGGATTANFTPLGVIKGTTRSAKNAGFYKFYCIAESGGMKLQSEIAEVAVGCGAKNIDGKWLSFMCFNLGAEDNITIANQINASISKYSNTANGEHIYVPGEERVYGSLFQWGRIADGHEFRNSDFTPRGTMNATSDIVSGNKCTTNGSGHPFLQIAKSATAWYSKFVTSTVQVSYNWHPSSQNFLDQLWRSGQFIPNDPCAHYNVGGHYQDFWHEGTDGTNVGIDACASGETDWRIPSQDEWLAIFTNSTSPSVVDNATANTWRWVGGRSSQNITTIRGFEVKPDNVTTTLFLPAGGLRNVSNAILAGTGTGGNYWSTSIVNTNSYRFSFVNNSISPTISTYRAYGLSVRCIKN